MITGLDRFVTTFKKITDGHISIYSNSAYVVRRWAARDFNVDDIVKEFDKDNRYVHLSVVKRAYDLVRAYHRTYRVYQQSREHYYRQAELDREKDNLIIDRIANNLNTTYTKIRELYGSRSSNNGT